MTYIKTNTPPYPQNAYTTQITAGLFEKTTMIAARLAQLYLIDKSNPIFKQQSHTNIIALIGEQDDIPPFHHPIIYKGQAYIDGRAFVNSAGILRNVYDFNFLVLRAQLDLEWTTNKEIFQGQEAFVVDAFASWFSNGLARNLELGLLAATNFKIAAAIYYLGIMHSMENMHKDEVILTLLKMLPRIIRVPAQVIDDLIAQDEAAFIDLYLHKNTEKPEYFSNIHKLITILNTITNNEVTVDISVIYNSLARGAFITTNAVELASMAVEYPPVLIAMLILVNQKSIQRNTGLGQILFGIYKKHDIDSFEKFAGQFT